MKKHREPILKQRTIPIGVNGSQFAMTIKAIGGLNYIHGNKKPYFSLTIEQHREGFPNQSQSFGADHETLLKYWPDLADLAALHLSDIDGVPMHAEENGWYWLAGSLLGHAGEQFHGGNSQHNFPKPTDKIDPEKPWNTTDYRNPTANECLEIFARHVRIEIETAREVRDMITDAAKYESKVALDGVGYDWRTGRAHFSEWIKLQQARWKDEADQCIAKHALAVYGDTWEPEKAMKGDNERD
jgi:hypothetical protein